MNRLRGIKSLWCDKGREIEFESVSLVFLGEGIFQLLSLINGVLLYSPSFAFFFLRGITLSALLLLLVSSRSSPVFLLSQKSVSVSASRHPPVSFNSSLQYQYLPTGARSPSFSFRSPPAPADSSLPSSSGES